MTAQIKNLHNFTKHIRNANTIDELALQLERFMDGTTTDYEDEFIDNYVGKALKLLNEFSEHINKMAEEELIKNKEQK